MSKSIPPALTPHILPFNWDVRKVWALSAPVQSAPFADLAYLLDLPLWSSVPKAGMLFDITPREVLACPTRCPHQYQRIRQADTSFPIDMLTYQGQNWILDGVHRLAKIHLMRSEWVALRLHSERCITDIQTD